MSLRAAADDSNLPNQIMALMACERPCTLYGVTRVAKTANAFAAHHQGLLLVFEVW